MNKQTDRQRQRLIQDFVQNRKHQIFDGMSLSQEIQKVYGIKYDWHITSDALVMMEQYEIVKEIGFTTDRKVKYLAS